MWNIKFALKGVLITMATLLVIPFMILLVLALVAGVSALEGLVLLGADRLLIYAFPGFPHVTYFQCVVVAFALSVVGSFFYRTTSK